MKQSAGHPLQFGHSLALFLEHAEHVLEVSRQLQHVSTRSDVQIKSRTQLFMLRTLTPLLVCAIQTLHSFANSTIAAQHVLLCVDVWIQTVQDTRKTFLEIAQYELIQWPPIPTSDPTTKSSKENVQSFDQLKQVTSHQPTDVHFHDSSNVLFIKFL